MKRKPTKPRKQLRIPKEDFFLLLVFAGVVPKHDVKRLDAAFPHKQRHQFDRGFDMWLRSTKRGREFLAILLQQGEAKCRAREIWDEYFKWYRQQHVLQSDPVRHVDGVSGPS